MECAKPVAEKLDADAETLVEHYNRHMDGFELCLELHKWAGWDVTREDMDTLDELDYLVDEAERAAVKTWAEEHNPKPPFQIGTRIKEGVITGLCDSYSPASYLVKEDGCTDETRRRIIRFEDAKAA
ncbi:hypothetical protein D3C76_1483530 [compost metagenome]